MADPLAPEAATTDKTCPAGRNKVVFSFADKFIFCSFYV
jgi:hypothetical protein